MQAMAIIEAQVAHIQSVRLLISVRAYQPANSIFLSQQTSISRTYQSRNQPANRPIDSYPTIDIQLTSIRKNKMWTFNATV